MEPKRIVIVDDEAIARDRIQRYLSELSTESAFRDVRFEIETAENGLSAVEKIKAFSPHIVLLDIQMPGFDGFEVLRQFENRDFQIVFQTAYDEFALKAFEESAIDYLLKPYPKERFSRAIEKALRMGRVETDAFASLGAGLRNSRRFLECLAFRQGGKLRALKVADVICFVSRDHCTSAFTADGESIVDFSLNHLELNLDPERFVRGHRNNIVALQHVVALSPRSNSEGASDFELSNGMRLPVSRTNRSKVAKRLRQP